MTTIVKSIVASMEWECRTRHFGSIKGQYICTLDNYHGSLDEIDASCSEIPDEHKSFNLIGLENGQFALYPNNRCRVYDISMTPKMPKCLILRYQLNTIKSKMVSSGVV